MKKKETLPDICMLGFSHKTAPVEVRERLVLGDDTLPVFFDRTCASGVEEIVYLSTCNRVEVYFTTRDMNEATESVIAMLEDLSGLARDRFVPMLYKKYSREAVLHLMTVVSSLDSMVVGENEIFYQIKNCYGKSVHAEKTGPVLNKLFHQAFRCGKRVRTETEISRNPLSIAYIATELARKIFEDLSQRRALLVGAGEMGELILKYFTKFGIGDITIANRSLHNAQRVAADINRKARIMPLEDIALTASEADIVISSASAARYIIDGEMIRGLEKKRGNRPLFMIDIAVPRNIDPACGKINNVFLYNIDDLKSIADENLKNRLKEVDIALGLVESDADDYMRWYDGLAITPAITKIRGKLDEIRRQELEKYRRRKMKHFSEEDYRLVEELTRQIMTKTLHNPIEFLKKNHGGPRKKETSEDTAKIIEDLFLE